MGAGHRHERLGEATAGQTPVIPPDTKQAIRPVRTKQAIRPAVAKQAIRDQGDQGPTGKV